MRVGKYERLPPRLTREKAAARLDIAADAIELVRRHSVNFYCFNYVARLAKRVPRLGRRGDDVAFSVMKDRINYL